MTRIVSVRRATSNSLLLPDTLSRLLEEGKGEREGEGERGWREEERWENEALGMFNTLSKKLSSKNVYR